MSEVLVDVENVSKQYCRDLKRSLWYGVRDLASEFTAQAASVSELRSGEFWAVNDVSFQLRRGECLGLMGPNGAGKSTLLKMLNGLIKPDGGSIRVRGRVGALIELGAGFHPVLTGRENIYVNGSILGMRNQEIDSKLDEIVEFAEIGDAIDAPVRTYSSGMRVRLGFAVAAMLEPDLLVIDEVLAVGDIGFRMKCYEHILALIERGTSIILVTHNVNDLSRVASRGVVLGSGKKLFDGDLERSLSTYEELIAWNRSESSALEVTNAMVANVRITDEAGTNKREFLTGDTIGVEIELRSKHRIPRARVTVAVESPTHGIVASLSTPYTGFEFDLLPTSTTIALKVNRLPLLVGAYSLNISLYGQGISDFFHRATAVAPFRVVGPPTDAFGFGVAGLVELEHSWCLQDRK
ncbi:MAG: ABC transporter ATP-binding protein [Planctomycetota bacterium]